jgi:hypothetical protein
MGSIQNERKDDQLLGEMGLGKVMAKQLAELRDKMQQLNLHAAHDNQKNVKIMQVEWQLAEN